MSADGAAPRQTQSPPDTREWTEIIDECVSTRFSSMCEMRRHLHQYPELSGREWETTRYIAAAFESEGLELRHGPERRGLIADPVEPPVAPRIALRGDIDALRIQDAKQMPHCSRVPGLMHACGHDGHAAVVWGATVALHDALKSGALPWPVRWRAIFQPAEETNRGALEMMDAGALDGVQALLSLHMDPSRPTGRIGVRTGALTADCDTLSIRVKGRGSHAARPHEARDPIAAAAQLVSSLYLFIPRSVDTHEPVVVTIGRIHGGENSNVIPDHVDLEGTMRTLGGAARDATLAQIRQLMRGVAEASGTEISMEVTSGPPSVYNDGGLTELLRYSGASFLGAANVDHIDHPSMGGEDFANYLSRVRGSMFRLGCTPPGREGYPLHSPLFDIDEDALAIGAKVLARTVVEWSNPERHRNEDMT